MSSKAKCILLVLFLVIGAVRICDAGRPASPVISSGGDGSNDRAFHTGTQAISTVTGLQAALDDKLDAVNLVSGQVGEVVLPEDPDNGVNVVGFKSPAVLAADMVWQLPAADGTAGQLLSTDGLGALGWATPFSGSWNDLLDRPVLFSGSYTDLTDKPTIPVDTNTQLSEAEVDAYVGNNGYLTGYTETDPAFAAWDKDYNDLINRPVIPTVTISTEQPTGTGQHGDVWYVVQ